MKVILKHSGRNGIDLCIETSDTCIIIYTSAAYDPYARLYIWLGKIRDRQLPASTIIVEGSYGVTLIAEATTNDTPFPL